MQKLTPTRPASAFVELFLRVVTSRTRLAMVLVLFFATAAGSPAHADVGVLLNESLDTSFARISGSGHSAVYFSRVCADTPVKLRLCRPEEQGSVISNYTTLGEDNPFEWNIVPLSIFLYGVEDPQNRPLFGSQKIKHVLEERYREQYLLPYCQSSACQTSNGAEWREMVGATLERSIYMFVVETSLEQDQAFIEKFNSLPNRNHFNGITRNCAEFSRRILNTYYPHAAKADYLNDLGLITPKAIARSFTHYAEHHPEAHLRVFHFAQLPGTIKRSSECRNVTEQLYRSKKVLVPMILFADHELAIATASYLLTGRFNPEHEFEHHPAVEASGTQQENAQPAGSSQEWREYRVAFGTLVGEAVAREIVPNRNFLDRLFKYLDHAATPSIDENGALWLDLSQGGKPVKLGLSESNILASGTDSQWAYALILARANHYLKSPKHSREIMPDFKDDWALLQSARVNSSSFISSENLPAGSARVAAASFNPNP